MRELLALALTLTLAALGGGVLGYAFGLNRGRKESE